MVISELCDYSNAYIVVKGRKSVTDTNATNKRNEKLTLNNNAPFRLCKSKSNITFTDSAEDSVILR